MSNMVQNQQCENCKAYLNGLNLYYTAQQSIFSEATRYTNTVISIGYATLISIIACTHEYISPIYLILSSGLLVISIFFFILHEIICMFLRNTQKQLINAKWDEFLSLGQTNVQTFRELQNQIRVKTEKIRNNYFKKWYKYGLLFGLTTLTVIGIVGILLYEYIIYLKELV